jgi:hypothetical protein
MRNFSINLSKPEKAIAHMKNGNTSKDTRCNNETDIIIALMPIPTEMRK